MPEHTPGPWNREWVAEALRHICRNIDSEVFLAEPLPENANTPSYYHAGDVDLIAAAPDLLAACKATVRAYASHQLYDKCPLDQLKAAVARAEEGK